MILSLPFMQFEPLQHFLYKTMQESNDHNSEMLKFEVENVIGQVIYIPKTTYITAVRPFFTSWECFTYSTKTRFQDASIVTKRGRVWNGPQIAIKLNQQVSFPNIQAWFILMFRSFFMHVDSNFPLSWVPFFYGHLS